MKTMSDDQRRELSQLAHSIRWSLPTKQDGRVRRSVKERFATMIYEAVDGLFDWFKTNGQPRALVIHQGAAWVVDPETKDFRIQQQKYPESVIGIYDKTVSRSQVIEDMREMPALASVLG